MQNYTILAASYKTKLTFVPYDPLITLLGTYSRGENMSTQKPAYGCLAHLNS